jgi:hypothetical protein
MELTQESFDKLMKQVEDLKTESSNKTKALDSEREKRKTHESTLNELSDKDKKKQEERLIKE